MSRTKIILLGATRGSSLFRMYLEQTGEYEVVAYAAERAYCNSEEFDSRPLVVFESLPELYPPSDFRLLNTVGFVQMNGVRARLQAAARAMGYHFATYVHPTAVVNSPLGEGCIVLELCSIGFRCSIGEGCIFWMGSRIAHDCKVGAFTYWGPGSIACGNTEIGERCFLGSGAVLRNRIRIAEKSLIGAGVYLNRPVEKPGSVLRAPYPVGKNIPSTEMY